MDGVDLCSRTLSEAYRPELAKFLATIRSSFLMFQVEKEVKKVQGPDRVAGKWLSQDSESNLGLLSSLDTWKAQVRGH